MKSWKKRWEEELDKKIPVLDEKVKNTPIVTAKHEKKSVLERFKETFYAYKKRLFAGLATCAAAIIALCVALPLLNTPVQESVISVEINPCALFTVDEKGIVTAVVAGNSDADVILSGGRAEQMEGKEVERATKIFVDYAAKLGYLNLSATDKTAAVRVSGCGNEKALERVGKNLETYFQDKGAYAAVVQENLSKEAFCTRMGIEAQETLEALTASLRETPMLFTQREIDTEEEIQGNLTQITANLLAKNKTKIMQNALDIAEIDALNTQIEGHEDNDGLPLLNDYWQVKDGVYTGEFATLLNEMESKLTAYQKAYGKSIENRWDMKTVLSDYADYTEISVGEYIDGLLVDFDFPTLFVEYLTISDLLENVGVTIPNTDVEDWISNFTDYLDGEFSRLVEEAKELYYEARETLSQSVYKDYTRQLEREYGSLSAYWDSLQNE